MSTLRVNTIQSSSSNNAISIASDGMTTPARLDLPFLSAYRTNGFTAAAQSYTSVSWETVAHSRYISCSGTNVQFTYPGKYLATMGWRFGNPADIWTGVRAAEGATFRGNAYGTGNVSSDSGPCEMTWIVDVPTGSVNSNYNFQIYRREQAMGVATPEPLAGRAITLFISYVGAPV
jgi:hypothetical protein